MPRYGGKLGGRYVRVGHAWAHRKYLSRFYASKYIRAEVEARRDWRGLWWEPKPPAPPSVVLV